jgi:phosphohistidine phosphatase
LHTKKFREEMADLSLRGIRSSDFLRHAFAGQPEAPEIDDDRPLTKSGIIKMEKAAESIACIVKSFDVILSSPLKRAHQTATIVAREMGYKDKIEHSDILRPGAQIDGLMNSLAKYGRAQKQSILLIGHEPDLSKIISSLTGMTPDSIEFKKSAFCNIEVTSFSSKAKGKLLWLLQPKLLRKIS